jgi:N utilization substance protein B
MKKRTRARELALQVLYSAEVAEEGVEKALADAAREERTNPESLEYARRLVAAVSDHRAEVDELIRRQCANWELHRVALIDKNILRIAIAEILYFDDIPPKVSIDEAIEMGKKFSTDKSGPFINGILDPIAFKHAP